MSENSFPKPREGGGRKMHFMFINTNIKRNVFLNVFTFMRTTRWCRHDIHLLADWQSNDAHFNMSSLIELTLFLAFSSAFSISSRFGFPFHHSSFLLHQQHSGKWSGDNEPKGGEVIIARLITDLMKKQCFPTSKVLLALCEMIYINVLWLKMTWLLAVLSPFIPYRLGCFL